MSYQRTEYHREVNRDDDRDQKSGGWKSWFGLGDNKDRDESDRYEKTTTYRNEHPSSYGYSSSQRYPETSRTGYSGAVSSGYSGARGGYGYTTSDEVNRGPSWNTDRDYNTRSSYGQPSGDRDVYYKQETRTYGGDRDISRPTPSYGGDYSSRSYTPTRCYGIDSDRTSRDVNYSRDYNTTSRDYSTPSRQQTSSYQCSSDRDQPTQRGYGFSGDRDYNVSRTYTTSNDRDLSSSRYPESRGYGYSSTSAGGYGGESSTFGGRPSYQQSSYRSY